VLAPPDRSIFALTAFFREISKSLHLVSSNDSMRLLTDSAESLQLIIWLDPK